MRDARAPNSLDSAGMIGDKEIYPHMVSDTYHQAWRERKIER